MKFLQIINHHFHQKNYRSLRKMKNKSYKNYLIAVTRNHFVFRFLDFPFTIMTFLIFIGSIFIATQKRKASNPVLPYQNQFNTAKFNKSILTGGKLFLLCLFCSLFLIITGVPFYFNTSIEMTFEAGIFFHGFLYCFIPCYYFFQNRNHLKIVKDILF